MNRNELNIAWCYPDILNLHGDRGNLMALKKVGELLDLDIRINKIESYKEKIDFEKTDILFLNSGELRVVKPIIEELNKQKEEITKYIENDKMIITIGTTGAIFSKQIERLDGEEIKGLGYLDMICKERETVYGNDIIFKLLEDETLEINGSQIQIIDTFLDNDIALGQVVYGHGNNGIKDNTEGAKYKNLIFTNCLGPILVKNPWYTEKLIRIAAKNRGIKIEKQIDKKEFEIEKKSMDCIKQYISKK